MIEMPDLATLRGHIGREIAVSDWITVSQARIDAFADATEDRQWIHVDEARAAAESPSGTTIAHGFLTLSLASALASRTLSFDRFATVINYGLNRVRFIMPVPAGSRVRARFSPVAVEEADGGAKVTWAVTFEREGGEKPCCVAEWIVRYYETRQGRP